MDIRIKRRGFLVICLAALLMFFYIPAKGTAPSEKSTETIFVVDCSSSMNEVDSEQLIYDSVHMMESSATEGYHFGFVAFNSKVVCKISLQDDEIAWKRHLEKISYDGYTNGGLALKTAVDMFSDTADGKRIIYISDGEMDMGTEEATENSVTQFRKQIKKAKNNNIQVTAIRVGNQNKEVFHKNCKEVPDTGGEILELKTANDFYEWCKDYIMEQLAMPYSSVGAVKATSRQLSIQLPDIYMYNAKVLLKGKHIPKYSVECQSKEMTDITGDHFVVLDMKKPMEDHISIKFSKAVPSDVEAYLLCDYQYQIKADFNYNKTDTTANINLQVVNPAGNNLLSGILHNQNAIKIHFDGEEVKYRFSSDNKIQFDVEIAETNKHIVGIDLKDVCGEFHEINPCAITIPVPEPDKSLWEKFLPLWIVLGVLIVVFCTIWFCFHRKKKKGTVKPSYSPDNRVIEVPVESKKKRYYFEGKINLYILKTKEEQDIPPQSINLYSKYSRDEITLQWILKTCNIRLPLMEAEKIIFKPGNKRALLVRNTSDATILKGRELLLKSQQYPIHFDEKITILFEEEEVELEIHYKNLKPNER